MGAYQAVEASKQFCVLCHRKLKGNAVRLLHTGLPLVQSIHVEPEATQLSQIMLPHDRHSAESTKTLAACAHANVSSCIVGKSVLFFCQATSLQWLETVTFDGMLWLLNLFVSLLMSLSPHIAALPYIVWYQLLVNHFASSAIGTLANSDPEFCRAQTRRGIAARHRMSFKSDRGNVPGCVGADYCVLMSNAISTMLEQHPRDFEPLLAVTKRHNKCMADCKPFSCSCQCARAIGPSLAAQQ